MAKKHASTRRSRRVATVRAPAGEPELIVVMKPDEPLATGRAGRARATAGRGVERMLRRANAELVPLFGAVTERTDTAGALGLRAGAAHGRPAQYFRVRAPRRALHALARELHAAASVEAAYVKPGVSLPIVNRMQASPAAPPSITPDFSSRQAYLDASPLGIDARFAWTFPGGRGESVRVIDIEGGWRLSHEDLLQNQGGLAGGGMFDTVEWRNHGTAVFGEISADDTPFGVTGIAPGANIKAISHKDNGSAGAIRLATAMLQTGDILLLEMHRQGPRFNFTDRPDQRGYIAVEWWPDDFEAIRLATAKGIIVVEAAGNGAESLDDPLYDTPAAGFPDTWRNPFRRGPSDSGAIIVGAGAPPPGTHGHDWGPDRSRLDFSNHGACVDAQGWGREVTTTGYGDLQGGNQEDIWYTDQFAGTSSASPIVVGALACVQGILKARSRPPLSPTAARQLLRATGSPQQDGPNGLGRIGSRPDVRQIITQLGVAGASPMSLNRPVTAVTAESRLTASGSWRAVVEDAANPGHRIVIDFIDGSMRVTWQNPSGEHQSEGVYVEIR